MTGTLIITVLSACALVGVDQLIKAWARVWLLPVQSMPLIPGVVELRFVYNDGAAFSMLAGKQGFLIAFTAVALLFIFVYIVGKRPQKKLEMAGWLLLLGGGIGNLVDRIAFGRVVDYINLLFMNFAVFNFADICVCTGVGLLLLDFVLEEIHNKKDGKA